MPLGNVVIKKALKFDFNYIDYIDSYRITLILYVLILSMSNGNYNLTANLKIEFEKLLKAEF